MVRVGQKLMSYADIIKIEESSAAIKEDIGFGGRVLLTLNQQGRSKAWLAEKIGISKQAINYLLNHASSPKYVNEIAAILEVSPEWLLLGKGSRLVYSKKDAGIISIPILSLRDIPQFIRHNDVNLSDQFTHISQNSTSNSCFAAILDNSCMEPLFNQGTLLIFNPDIAPKNGDYVIFSCDNEILFRQYFIDGKEIYLKSIDTMFKSFKQNDIEIFGVLIESRNHFK